MSAVTMRASTGRELASALVAAGHHAGQGHPVLVEAVLDPDYAPPPLRELASRLART